MHNDLAAALFLQHNLIFIWTDCLSCRVMTDSAFSRLWDRCTNPVPLYWYDGPIVVIVLQVDRRLYLYIRPRGQAGVPILSWLHINQFYHLHLCDESTLVRRQRPSVHKTVPLGRPLVIAMTRGRTPHDWLEPLRRPSHWRRRTRCTVAWLAPVTVTELDIRQRMFLVTLGYPSDLALSFNITCSVFVAKGFSDDWLTIVLTHVSGHYMWLFRI